MAKDEDKNKIDKDLEPTVDQVEVAKLVDELQVKYPNVIRGDIFEACSCISDEGFLLNYLADKQKANTRVDSGFSLSDVFKAGDTKEIMSLIDLGTKAKTSKTMIILAASLLSVSKTMYHVFTDDEVKKALEDVDTANAVRMISDAKALTEKANSKVDENIKNKG